jgi:hypothetical protein
LPIEITINEPPPKPEVIVPEFKPVLPIVEPEPLPEVEEEPIVEEE